MSSAILEQPKALINLGALKKKRIHLAIFGRGKVGEILVDQMLERKAELLKRRNLDLNIFCIANSTRLWLPKQLDEDWRSSFLKAPATYNLEAFFAYVQKQQLKNLIVIDNTASEELVSHYPRFVKEGFHLVSSNKIANTQELSKYTELRHWLQLHEKEYLYETNVGAGLPLVDTIKLLHLSGENITRIRGVFSGTLSYIFNTFSSEEIPFSEVLSKAIRQGFTEPDPREDLCGMDVARKLLILARELDLHNELKDVSVQNLIPKEVRKLSKEVFLNSLQMLDVPFQIKKRNLKENEVLRYVADLHGNLMDEKGAHLTVSLVPTHKNSVLGQLKGSDSLFEIYTESYGEHPIVIQGAGAGAKVTARGVFGDVLRLSDKI